MASTHAWNADLGVLRGPLRHWRGVAGEEESQCARIAAKRAVKQALERDKPSRLDAAPANVDGFRPAASIAARTGLKARA
jgi:hypothetical protein